MPDEINMTNDLELQFQDLKQIDYKDDVMQMENGSQKFFDFTVSHSSIMRAESTKGEIDLADYLQVTADINDKSIKNVKTP